MISATSLAWDDTVLPFQLDASDARGRVARLDGALNRILAQHAYPPAVEALVAETVALTALIGQTIKLRWKLSLQVRGKGAVRLIATDYYGPEAEGEPARLRAYASYDPDQLSPDLPAFDQIGQGYLAVMLDQGEGMVPYQGFTPLEGGSLSACAEHYFAQSEQIPTRFRVNVGQSREPGKSVVWRAGGVMLQHMPKASRVDDTQGEALAEARVLAALDEENWSRAQILLDTVEEIELIGPTVSPTDLLVRLFHEESPRAFPAQPVAFGCSCSEAKVRNSLSIYSAKDISRMTTPEGVVTADCQFCGAHYRLDPETVGFEAKRDA
jgi:molecular chaperone Hsp33